MEIVKLICQILVFSCSCWILHCYTFKVFHPWHDSMNFYLRKITFCKWWPSQWSFLFERNSIWLIYSIDSYLKGWSYTVSKDSGKPLYEFGKCWKMSGNSGGKISLAWTEILPSMKTGTFTGGLWIQFVQAKSLARTLSLFFLLVLEPDLLMVIVVKSCCSISRILKIATNCSTVYLVVSLSVQLYHSVIIHEKNALSYFSQSTS